MTGTSGERRVVVGLVVVATLVRVVAWAVRPDFWGDESALAMNISPKSLSEIGRPYVYWQICPWLFLVIAKLITFVFGDNELSLRLLPLLGGIAVPPLAYLAADAMAGRRAGIFALALTAFSPHLVYYSTELKPYATDAGLTAAVLALTLSIIRRPDDLRLQVGLLIAGALGVWISLPLIFVLGGCAAALGLGELFTRRRPLALSLLAIAAIVWGGGFYVHLTRIVSVGSIATSSGVSNFWSDGFMPFPPKTLAELRWLPGKFFLAFFIPGGFHSWLRHVAGLVFLFGAFLVWRTSRVAAVALTAPLVLLVAASALQRYPMLERLILFAVPILMIGMAVAFDRFADFAARPALLALALLSVHPVLKTAELLMPRFDPGIEDFARRLAEEPQPTDAIYIDDTTKAPYLFYEWKYPPAVKPIDTESIGLIGVVIGEHQEYLDQLAPLFGKERVYVLLSIFPIPFEMVFWDDYITEYLDRSGGVRLEEVRSRDYLFVIYDLSLATP